MQSVQDFAEGTERFSSTYSYASLMAMMNGIWTVDESGELSLPSNPLTLNLFVLALKATNYPFLQALCDKTNQKAHLVLRTTDLASGEFVSLLESVEQFAKDTMPEGVTVSAKAGLHTILQADREIVAAQLGSLVITIIAMLAAMTVLWHSLKLAAVSLGISLVPLAVLAVLAALFEVPLNSVTVMVAALVLGTQPDLSTAQFVLAAELFQPRELLPHRRRCDLSCRPAGACRDTPPGRVDRPWPEAPPPEGLWVSAR